MRLKQNSRVLKHATTTAIIFLLAACGSENFNIEPPPQSRFTVDAAGTVTDKRTSLVWEQVGNSSWQTYFQAEQYCGDLNLGGYTDWRVPELRELQSIVDYTRPTTAIASDLFSVEKIPATSGYWSSTLSAYDPDYRWYVNFDFGNVAPYHTRSFGISIRCVRGVSSIPAPNLTDNGNGTATDLANHLMWEQHANENGALATRDWNAAGQYCQDLVLGGYSDWRLPDVTELTTIVDYSRSLHAIDSRVFYNSSTWSYFYWTSTSTATANPYVWKIDFVNGAIGYNNINIPYLTRCVRTIL